MSGLTFDLLVVPSSVLLRFRAHCGGGLSADSRHGDGWDLVDDVHRLHDGGGATCCRYDGWRRHGVGHRFHGRLRHLPLHGDQHGLVVECGAYQRTGLNVKVSGQQDTYTGSTSECTKCHYIDFITSRVLCKASLLDDSEFGLD